MALIQADFYSEKLKRATTIKVVIPHDPGVGGVEIRKDIPTLYLLHGYTGNHADWLTNTRIREYAGTYGVAVIMPSGENSFYLDDPEKSEYFGEFIGEELVEYTRTLFPLSRRREDTYIGGLSMGGYGAVRNGLKYSGTFSKIMGFSGAYIHLNIIDNDGMPVDDEVTTAAYKRRIFGDGKILEKSDRNPAYLAEQLGREGRDVPKIFMTCGTEDSLLSVNRKMRNQLEEAGADVSYAEDGGDHDWDYWNKHLEKALKWAVEK